MAGSTPAIPKLHEHDGQGLAIGLSFAILVTMSVILRFATKLKTRTSMSGDDWLVIAAYIPWMGFFGSFIWAYIRGAYMVPLIWLPYPILIEYLKIVFNSTICACISFSMSRFSILYLYYRLFPGRKFRILVWVTAALNLCYAVATFFVSVFRCSPIDAAWDPLRQNLCLDYLKFFFAMESFVIVIDLLVVLIPINVVRQLQLRLRQKIQLSLVFALGLFTTIISVIRLATTGSDLIQLVSTKSATWYYIQISLALICVNCPTYGPLVSPVHAGTNRMKKWYESTVGKIRSGLQSTDHRTQTGVTLEYADSQSREPIYTSERASTPLQTYKMGGHAHISSLSRTGSNVV